MPVPGQLDAAPVLGSPDPAASPACVGALHSHGSQPTQDPGHGEESCFLHPRGRIWDVTLGSGRELPRGPAHRVLQPLRLALALPSIQQKLFLESLLSQSASHLSDPGWRKS